jgi:outer membrane protein
MKRSFLFVFILLFGFTFVSAQKYAYVDTEYILDNIPEYKDAQSQLDELAEEYKNEIENARTEIDRMYKAFQAEVVLMPEDIKQKKEEEIRNKEAEVKELQNKRFGLDGDLFLKREELIKPIQEKIYNAIEDIAIDKNYAFVFDKAGSLTMLYVSSKFDISDDVLDAVGGELGTVRREDRVKNEYVPEPSETKIKNPKNDNMPPGPGGTAPGPVKRDDKK